MTASFDGNDGNDGNTANAGGAGNMTSTSAGWFLADRIDLPLVTELDTGPNAPARRADRPIADHQSAALSGPQLVRRLVRLAGPERFRGTAWQAINPTDPPPGFVGSWPWPTWVPYPAPANWSGLNAGADVRMKSAVS